LLFLALPPLFLFVLSYWQVGEREVQTRAAAAPSTGRFVRAADVDLFVQEAGPESGPPVLFIHAAGGWSETWRRAMTAVAAKGFRAIAVDLPPLGYSERPAGADYRTEVQAKRLVGLLDALHISCLDLVGHSFGSRPTVELAMLVPERIRALVLVSAALVVSSETATQSDGPWLLRALLEMRPLREAAIGLTLSNPRFTKWIFARFVADTAVASDALVGIYSRPLALEGTTRALGEWLPFFLTIRDASLSADRASYGKLTMPILLVWGDRDTTTPLARGQYLRTLLSGSGLVVMKGIGHMPPQENPDEFNAILLQFLAQPGNPAIPRKEQERRAAGVCRGDRDLPADDRQAARLS
jgi:pimeloyl-ACP methyl ester carboxylesterase